MEEVDISAESICRSEILAQHRQRSSVRLTMGLSLTWRYYLLRPEFGRRRTPSATDGTDSMYVCRACELAWELRLGATSLENSDVGF